MKIYAAVLGLIQVKYFKFKKKICNVNYLIILFGYFSKITNYSLKPIFRL
jgi:hypothetical protein